MSGSIFVWITYDKRNNSFSCNCHMLNLVDLQLIISKMRLLLNTHNPLYELAPLTRCIMIIDNLYSIKQVAFCMSIHKNAQIKMINT